MYRPARARDRPLKPPPQRSIDARLRRLSDAVDILGLTTGELIARANARLENGAGVAIKVYRRAIYDGRFEPEAFGLKERAVAAWRTRTSKPTKRRTPFSR